MRQGTVLILYHTTSIYNSAWNITDAKIVSNKYMSEWKHMEEKKKKNPQSSALVVPLGYFYKYLF